MLMYVICILFLTILPTIFLGVYIYKKDLYEKESPKLLFSLFLAGIGATIVTIVISVFMEKIAPFFAADTLDIINYSYLELFIYVFIGIALVEEFSKWIFVKKITWRSREFNSLYDAIVYCVFVSLGFATIENLLYALEISTVQTVLLRAVLAVPGHAFDGVFMGYYLGRAKLFTLYKEEKKSKKALTLSLLVPTILHGAYDFVLYAEIKNSVFLVVFGGFILFLYIAAFICITKISKNTISFMNETKE